MPGDLVRATLLVRSVAGHLVGLFMNLVARVLDRVLDAIAEACSLVAQRLVAIGLAQPFLYVRLGIADGLAQVAHHHSSVGRGRRRGGLEPSHRQLLDASWELLDELQPDHRGNPFNAAIPPHHAGGR